MAMMSWMRWIAPYLLAAVLITFLGSLAYFGARGLGEPGSQQTVVTINGEGVSAVAYQRAYRQAVEQYRQAFRDRFSEDLLRSLKVQDQVLDRLVVERLIGQRAATDGITVSDEELSDVITRVPAFQEGGRFSRERYLRLLALSNPPMTPTEFEEGLRAELTRQKVQALVAGGAKVSEAEARQQWEGERTRVRAAYLLVTPVEPGETPVPDAELETYYAAHPAEFTQPERRRVLVALLPGTSVAVPTISDAEVEVAYKARRAQFETPTRVHLAHILIRVPSVGGSAAEDQAKAKADTAFQRIRGGADFAQVARETSEDQQTAARGGDLGLIAQGELVPELDKVIFGLKAGEVAGPIRSPFGYHVVKALEVVPGTKKDLKEVAGMLRATLAAEGQLKALREKAEAAQQGLVTASDFSAEARRQGLTVREIGPLTRTDAVEGIGRVREATDAIFALAADGVSSAVKVPEGYAVFRLVERQPSRASPLAEVKEDVLRAVRRQKAQETAQAKAAQLAEVLRKGEDPRVVAKRDAATYGEVGPFSRAEPIADKSLGQALAPVALALPDGAVGGPVAGPGGVYVVKLLGRERPAAADFDKVRADLETRLLQEKRTRLWEEWLATARAAAKVEINRKVLPEG